MCLAPLLGSRVLGRLARADGHHGEQAASCGVPTTVGDVVRRYREGRLGEIADLGARGISEIEAGLMFAWLLLSGITPVRQQPRTPATAPGLVAVTAGNGPPAALGGRIRRPGTGRPTRRAPSDRPRRSSRATMSSRPGGKESAVEQRTELVKDARDVGPVHGYTDEPRQVQLPTVDLSRGEVDRFRACVFRARDLGLLPEPDRAGRRRWSAEMTAPIRDRWAEIQAVAECVRAAKLRERDWTESMIRYLLGARSGGAESVLQQRWRSRSGSPSPSCR